MIALFESSNQMRTRLDAERERLDSLEKLLTIMEDNSHPKVEIYMRNRDKITETTRNAAIAFQKGKNANETIDANLNFLEIIWERLSNFF